MNRFSWPPFGGALRASVLLIGLVCLAQFGAAAADQGPSRFEFEEPEMGVPFRILLYAPDSSKAEEAARAAFARVAQLNQIMSDYETDSELNELSRTSGKSMAVHVSDDLWTVLERAQEFARMSNGAFDVTVGPVVSLWRKARREHRLPDPEKLAQALKAVGYKKMQLDPPTHKVELLVPGMKLDLGGIAKGYALDEEIKVLQAHGIERALVSGGGDMAISGPPPGKTGWRVEIAPLDVTNAPPKKFVLLANAGLATSGDTFQRLEIDGKRYSHIVDPQTGIGITDHSLVTIIADGCMTADGSSKIVSVLGPDRGLKIIQSLPGVEAHVMREPLDQLEIRETPGFGRFYDH
jgi:thiamine biosynthesis lipoprotein